MVPFTFSFGLLKLPSTADMATQLPPSTLKHALTMFEPPVVTSLTLAVTCPVLVLIATGYARVPETIGAWVSPEFTVWGSPADVLPLKLRSPAYVAVSVLAPGEVKVSEQVPAATVPVQLMVPSLTVTFPVGVPAPGELTDTV